MINVKLDSIRGEIQQGDLLFFRGSGWLPSRLIRLFTTSVYSHVGIMVVLSAGEYSDLWVVEAVWPRVRLYPLRRTLENKTRVDWFQVVDPAVDRHAVVVYGLERVGRRYASFRQFVRSWGCSAGRLLGWKADVDQERDFCSELVAEAFLRAGYVDDREPALTSPGAVALYTCLRRRGTLTL